MADCDHNAITRIQNALQHCENELNGCKRRKVGIQAGRGLGGAGNISGEGEKVAAKIEKSVCTG